MKRHPELSLCQLEAISLSWATGFNQVQVGKFYNNLKQLKTEKNIPVARIYNVDESGISTVTKATNQIVASKGMKQVGKLTSSERGKIITIICAINAQGNFIPPFFIFPCKRLVPALLYGATHGAKGITSSSGWTDGKIFQAWLQHFQAIVNSSIDEKVMLILDNYSSHLYLPAINFARKHGIEILSIPPHTSHKLQPLDLTFFGPLKTYYSQEIDKWMVDNPGKCVMEYNVAQLLNAAYEKAATLRNALNGFRSNRIVPFNPDVFSECDLVPVLLTEINTKDASSMNMPLNQEALVKEENTEISESVTSNASANNIITPAAVFQVTNTSHTPNETPLTSTHLSTFDLQHEELDSEVVTQVKSTLTFSQLSPFLNAQLVTKKISTITNYYKLSI